MSPGGGEVACAQGVAACIVVQQAGTKPVAGSFGAGDGLGEQLPAASWAELIGEQQVHHQDPAEHDIVADLPGVLDSLLREGKTPLRLTGVEVCAAEYHQRIAEQLVVALLAGELHRLLAELPGRCNVMELRKLRGRDQCCAIQPGLRAGLGPLQHWREQAEGFLVAGARHPVQPERSTKAHHPRGPT